MLSVFNKRKAQKLSIIDNKEIQLGSFRIHLATFPPDDVETLWLAKKPDMARAFISRIQNFRGGNLLEIGINGGGSTALLAHLCQPKKLVSLELNKVRRAALDGYIEAEHSTEQVKCFYGVDQGDSETLRRIIEDEFDGPIDLVIDDASHLYFPTKATFETVFPFMRPKTGTYLLEDWMWEHGIASGLAYNSEKTDAVSHCANPSSEMAAVVKKKMEELSVSGSDFSRDLQVLVNNLEYAQPSTAEQKRTPLTTLLLRLVLLKAVAPGFVGEILIQRYWAAIRRGPEAIDPDNFELEDPLLNCFDQLS